MRGLPEQVPEPDPVTVAMAFTTVGAVLGLAAFKAVWAYLKK